MACSYLIGYLWEMGPVLAGGFGHAPLTQGEIRAWQANVGITLQPWEARFMRRLSYEYIAETHRAESPDCKAPWSREVTPDVRAVVADRMMLAIRAMKEL